jgi:hypothetical protein
MGQYRDIAHRRESGMGEIVEGVIRRKTIELEVDPGLQDGGVVEVVIRLVKQPLAWGVAHLLLLEMPETPIKA